LDHGKESRLFVDGAVVSLEEGVFLEVAVGAAGAVAAVEADGASSEFAGQAQVPPGGDVLGEAALSASKDGVHLLHADQLDRPLLHGTPPGCRWPPPPPFSFCANLSNLSASSFFISRLMGPGFAGCPAFDEGRRVGGALALPRLESSRRLFFFEVPRPIGHEVVQGVGPNGVEVAGDTGDLLVGGPFRGRP
jgi:hypothetical protein